MISSTAAPAAIPLPEWLRLPPGRSVLWRSPDCVQLGLSDASALVIEGLSEPLATLLRGLDGAHRTSRLIADAVASGAAVAEVRAVLGELVSAGLATPATDPSVAVECAVDAEAWSLHSGQRCDEVIALRRAATVVVGGRTRLAPALAISLAVAGVGRVVVDTAGTVEAGDVGTGYRLADVGLPRSQAARDALQRAVPSVHTELPARCRPDLVVLADALVPEPDVLLDLQARRVPHLAVHAHEGVAVVGPLVLPGRSSCLRCVQLRRTELDPMWPKLAAQLVSAVPFADVACTQVAAALGAEQVLAVLAGPGCGAGVPATWGASLELDPLRGQLRKRHWHPHPRCGCGALTGAVDRTAATEPVSDAEPIRETIEP